MRASLYRFIPETYPDTNGKTHGDLTYYLIAYPSLYDCAVRDIDGSAPFCITFGGNELGVDYPFGNETDDVETSRLRAWRSNWNTLRRAHAECPNDSLLTLLPANEDLLHFESPMVEEEQRLRTSRRRYATYYGSSKLVDGS